MARSIAEIKQVMIDYKNSDSVLSGLTSPSQTAVFNLIFYACAVAINTLEQLMDILKGEITDIVASAAPGNNAWWRDKILKFQYSATTPQVVQLVDLAPVYVPEDESLRIITQVSVNTGADRKVTIKVAKGVAPALEPLTAPEMNALDDYINEIQFSGTDVKAVSLNSDRLKVVANIYYRGQYVETVVKAAVIDAINEYLKQLDFNGTVYITGNATEPGLVDFMQRVEGVKDVKITAVYGRPYAVAPGSSQVTNVTRIYPTAAGHIIAEDNSGDTLDDTLTMILS